MKVISIANRKGGIGKTTFTVNIARELVRMGYLVVVVDLDSQCDLTKILRPTGKVKGDVMDLLEGSVTVEEAVCTVQDNLHIIPGSENLAYLRDEKIQVPLSKDLSDEHLKNVEFVLVDHPPGLNPGALQGFYASTDVLVPIEPEALCVRNISDFLDDLIHIQETGNPQLNVLGLAFNRIDSRRDLTGKTIKKVERMFGSDVFRARVSNNTAIPISLSKNISIRDLKWWAKTNGQFRDLTAELLGRVSK